MIGGRSGYRNGAGKEHFAAPSIVESYEPDRTKVMVEFEADDSELEEVIGKTSGDESVWPHWWYAKKAWQNLLAERG